MSQRYQSPNNTFNVVTTRDNHLFALDSSRIANQEANAKLIAIFGEGTGQFTVWDDMYNINTDFFNQIYES